MTNVKSPKRKFASAALPRRGSATTLRLRRLMDQRQVIEIGQRIAELRDNSIETNRSIADYAGVTEKAVGNWLPGQTGIPKNPPTYDHAKKLAALFSVDVDWLWRGKRQPAPDVLEGLAVDDELRDQLNRIETMLAAISEEVGIEELREAAGPLAQLGDQAERKSARPRRGKRRAGDRKPRSE